MRLEFRDHAEVALVAGHPSMAQVKRGCADEEIGEGDHLSALASVGIASRDEKADFTGKAFRCNSGEHHFQIAAPLGSLLQRLRLPWASTNDGHAVLLSKLV